MLVSFRAFKQDLADTPQNMFLPSNLQIAKTKQANHAKQAIQAKQAKKAKRATQPIEGIETRNAPQS